MARVIPFRGVRYNSEKVSDLKDVTAPPHDVISPEEQRNFYQRHPHNVIRLILGAVDRHDDEDDNRYTRAAGFLNRWLEEKILLQDPEPAFYLTETDYTADGSAFTRFGFVALVQLEGYDSGGILPHEKTFSGTRTDRLRLLEACRANFNPVFTLYSDPDAMVSGALRSAVNGEDPDVVFEDVGGCRHRLWRVTDPKVHKAVEAMLAEKALYIADGHHRYETALNYRNQTVGTGCNRTSQDPRQFIMMYLTSMHDPGLLIRPAHRLICRASHGMIREFLNKARSYFEIQIVPFNERGTETTEKMFLQKIHAGATQCTVGAAIPNRDAFYVLHLKEGTMDRLFKEQLPPELRALDVTVVTKLVLERILGLTAEELDNEETIVYTSRRDTVFKTVYSGRCAMALVLNPTRLSQLEAVSNAGLIMPRKSTYFYPKTVSGLVTYKMAS